MVPSIASLNATCCHSTLSSQFIYSRLCGSRLRVSRNSVLVLSSPDFEKDFTSRFYNEISCQRSKNIMKKATESRCNGLQAADSTRVELQELRASRLPMAVVCHSSRSSSGMKDISNIEDFVEIGTIAETHGIYGELRVRSLTDFPEERFEMVRMGAEYSQYQSDGILLVVDKQPGTRWIQRVIMGKPCLTKVELVEGREIYGKQSSWLVTLKGFDTPEKASELLGATMVVRADERPASLREDEDYIPDLVGMDVVIQDTKEAIGTVVDVHNSGANDLLRVQLRPSNRGKDIRIWIPFVKDIVPVVDSNARRIEIKPPYGLLDLNVPKEGLSRKEIWKQERKKNAVLAAVRKRLTALGQAHILEGLSKGEDSQRQALVEQLMSMDFGLFQRALLNALGPSNAKQVIGEPDPPSGVPRVNWADFETWSNVKKYNKTPLNSDNDTARWYYKGLQLIADGEVAVVVLAGGQGTRLGPGGPPVKGMLELDLPEARSLFELQAERLLLVQELALQVYPESAPQIPWLVLTSDATDRPTRLFFEEKEYFGLDESQVWFVKQDSLPCIDCNKGHAILLESPWKMATAPTGNGGLFSALHAQGFLDRLSEEGIQYVQVYSVDNALARVADPVFFGYAHEREADVGVKVVKRVFPEEAVGVLCLQRSVQETPNLKAVISDEDAAESDDIDAVEERCADGNPETSTPSYYGVLEYSEMPDTLRTAKEGDELMYRGAHICVNLFSLDYLKKLADTNVELRFHAALKKIPCLKESEWGEWTTQVPDQPNGLKLEQFIFDIFKYCDLDKVALLEVDRDEEFAPVKHGSGQDCADTAETARDMVLALQNRLSTTSEKDELAESGQHEEYQYLSLLRAYIGGGKGRDV